MLVQRAKLELPIKTVLFSGGLGLLSISFIADSKRSIFGSVAGGKGSMGGSGAIEGLPASDEGIIGAASASKSRCVCESLAPSISEW